MSDGTYLFAIGPCISCDQVFSFNPDRVPSIRINRATGRPDPLAPREPVCGECMAGVNADRKTNGLEPHPIHPDAYAPANIGD